MSLSGIRLSAVLAALVALSLPVVAQGPPAVLKMAKTIRFKEYMSYNVDKGGTLVVSGILNGNILVGPGGESIIYGVVNGDVTNNGGTLKVFGNVSGSVLKKAGTTHIDAGASIAGGIRD